MPQGRRKVPFSGKAKKLQLQAKRQGQASKPQIYLNNSEDQEGALTGVQKINHQPSQRNPEGNRYALQFYRETEAELRKQKEYGRKAIHKQSAKDLEIVENDYFKDMDFPKRPPWTFTMTLDEIQKSEHKYFTEYVKELERRHGDLSHFELNLETWRQLWRVLEMSDIVLVIADIRYPSLMFPPSLYKYVTEEIKKQIIFVLNKIDLAPAPLVCAWYNYFKQTYPAMHILLFTSLPGYNLVGNSMKSGLKSRKLRGKPKMSSEGAEYLFRACKDIVKDRVDLSSWETKIQEEKDSTDSDELQIGEILTDKKNDTSFVEHELYKNGILTIGCIGQPNVGKSSLMNALMGKKVVSVSKTPGHTKHFQTIFLTNTVRLCDCPGLVFPSLIPRYVQVLMGSYPISQLRETFSTIRFVAERLDLPTILRLTHPDEEEEWSPYHICEAWAIKRGFLTARAARPDIHRAGINLLQLCLSGIICLRLAPPNYFDNIANWEAHEDIEKIKKIQANSSEMPKVDIESDEFSDGPDDNDSAGNESASDKRHTDSDGESDLPAIQNKFSILTD